MRLNGDIAHEAQFLAHRKLSMLAALVLMNLQSLDKEAAGCMVLKWQNRPQSVDGSLEGGSQGFECVDSTQHHFPGALAKLNLFRTPPLRHFVSSLRMGTKGPSSERGPCSSPSSGKPRRECSQPQCCGRARSSLSPVPLWGQSSAELIEIT